MPDVTIIEVGPRDGLQNEKHPVSTEIKANFVRNLLLSGLSLVEATSFVSPKWVPQLGDAADLIGLLSDQSPSLMALVPNEKGLERALASGISRIALFTAASDDFTKANVNMSVAETLDVFRQLIARFRAERPHGFVRGYVSTIVQCPYAGLIPPEKVAEVANELRRMGVNEISLGETLGVAVPPEIQRVAQAVDGDKPSTDVAWHFHDTRGTAVANAIAMLDRGYRRFDSSAGGLGGCPYAPGAGGNVATEDLVYAFERIGFKTGVNLDQLSRASLPVLSALGREPFAKAQRAALASQ